MMKLSKFVLTGLAFIIATLTINAQDIEAAKEAIEKEEFNNAKIMLKQLIKENEKEGVYYYLLGDVYLNQELPDSAKVYFDKGINASRDEHFSRIGLGQIALDKGDKQQAKKYFDQVINEKRSRDYLELLYIGRAYMRSLNPDYGAAVKYLEEAIEIEPSNPKVLLALGNAYVGNKNPSKAYAVYRQAYNENNALTIAEVNLAALTRNAGAFQEAVTSLNSIAAKKPNYAPVYRELAETYYLWAKNDEKNYATHIQKALSYYKKYMDLTEHSIENRMRYADFLILAKDYVSLEEEAKKMQKEKEVNTRIYRYLGYSAYHNKNIDGSIEAINEFINLSPDRVIGRDYLYLGFSKIKIAIQNDSLVKPKLFEEGISDLEKAVKKEPALANELADIGKDFFKKKLYKEASKVFEVAVSNKNSSNYLYDNFYLGYALYFDQASTDTVNPVMVKEADKAFAKVAELSPTTQDAYLYRARSNSILENDIEAQKIMIENYQKYMDVVTAKGQAALSENSTKKNFVEAYTNMAIYYIENKEKEKALEALNNAKKIKPVDEYLDGLIKKANEIETKK